MHNQTQQRVRIIGMILQFVDNTRIFSKQIDRDQ